MNKEYVSKTGATTIPMTASKRTQVITILLIIAAALSISLPGAFSSGTLWPDGKRYTFNGILLHDMIRDGGIFHPMKYNVMFYAQYPATNLPYGPPFLASVFAVAFSIFGVSFMTARFVIAIYTICAALMCWHLVYKLNKNYWCSILAVSAFLFNPLTLEYSRDITPELPYAFFAFLTIYFFYHYVQSERKYFGIFAALALGFGFLTKQYIIPLGIALPLYIIIQRKWHILCKCETWIAVFIAIILIVPYTKFSVQVNTKMGPGTELPIDSGLLLAYPNAAIKLIPTLTILAIIGFIIGLIKKNKLINLCLIWAVCWYVFFTLIFNYLISEKFLFSLVPAMIIPFAFSSHKIILALKRKHLDKAIIILLIFWFTFSALSKPVFYVRGYEDAGEYIAKNPHGKSVLFHGVYDGTFMMGIRRHISKGGPYVLRGDRHLAVRLWFGEEHALPVDSPVDSPVGSPDWLPKFLNYYQTGYVVVESGMKKEKDFPEYKMLMKALEDTNLFNEVARFPIRTNYTKRLGTELIAYRFNFNENEKKADTYKFPVPTLWKDIEVPF